MTLRERTAIRLLLLVAKHLAPEALAKEIEDIATRITLYPRIEPDVQS